MEATNMAQLEQMILKEMKTAMTLASDKMLKDMREETSDFYTQGNPVMYKRTGALGDTPKTTSVSQVGNSLSYDAYLDTSHNYTTGSNPTMLEVLNLANYKIPFITKNGYDSKPTLGKSGFWERSKNKMEKTLNSTMKKFFR